MTVKCNILKHIRTIRAHQAANRVQMRQLTAVQLHLHLFKDDLSSMVSHCKKRHVKICHDYNIQLCNSLSTHSILNSNTSATNNIQLKENTHIYIHEQ